MAGWFCRSTERELCRRVRKILAVCQADGGYCLGSGNSIAKYVPLDNYLVMLDGGPALGRVKPGISCLIQAREAAYVIMPDGVHLTASGHAVVAETVARVLVATI